MVLNSLAPARRRLVYGCTAVTAVAIAASVFVLTRSATPTKPVSQGTAGPVLLVPGYGGSTTALDSLASVLRAGGKDVTVLALPGDARGDLGAQAAALGVAAAKTLDRTGAASVDVVGYSAGGVVARLWVRQHGGAARARRVISLGSPQHGTDLASLAGRSCLEPAPRPASSWRSTARCWTG